MRRAWHYLIALVVGTGIGVGSTALALSGKLPVINRLVSSPVEVGGWKSDFTIGSQAADPYTRAQVARFGLLALAKSEAVYFTATRDQTGARLREECTYRLSLGPMPARWWSVTLYDATSMLPRNNDGALSINAEQARGDETTLATIAPRRPPGGGLWISSRNAGQFDLSLRLYQPEPALLADPETVLDPPRIERISCGGAE